MDNTFVHSLHILAMAVSLPYFRFGQWTRWSAVTVFLSSSSLVVVLQTLLWLTTSWSLAAISYHTCMRNCFTSLWLDTLIYTMVVISVSVDYRGPCILLVIHETIASCFVRGDEPPGRDQQRAFRSLYEVTIRQAIISVKTDTKWSGLTQQHPAHGWILGHEMASIGLSCPEYRLSLE